MQELIEALKGLAIKNMQVKIEKKSREYVLGCVETFQILTKAALLGGWDRAILGTLQALTEAYREVLDQKEKDEETPPCPTCAESSPQELIAKIEELETVLLVSKTCSTLEELQLEVKQGLKHLKTELERRGIRPKNSIEQPSAKGYSRF